MHKRRNSIYKVIRSLALLGTALLATGCAAKEVVERTFEKTFERSATRLAEADFGPDARYAVVVLFEPGAKNSMHGALVQPIADQLAIELRNTFGMRAEALNHGAGSDWSELQLLAAGAGNDKDSRPDRGATSFSPFFRQAGYRGYALFTLRETTDDFSRNEFDYSIRGRMSLRELRSDEKGDNETVLARIAMPQSVCSRLLRKPPAADQMIIASAGYKLRNPARCTATVMARVREGLAPLAVKP